MEPFGFIFLFVVMIMSYVILKFIIFHRARRESELRNRAAQSHDDSNSIIDNGIRQTYIISPIYTIEANRAPVPYEAAVNMPRTTRSTRNAYKTDDDDLPSYDQAVILSKPIGSTSEDTNVPTTSVTNAVER